MGVRTRILGGKLAVSLALLSLGATACMQPDAKSPAGDPAPSSHPGPQLLSCGSSLPFPASAMESTGNIEAEDSDLGRALRSLMEGDFPSLREGYRVLEERDDKLIIGAGNPVEGYVAFEHRDGAWAPLSWGGCRLQPHKDGLEIGRWQLDPDFPSPEPGDTSIHVLAADLQCASGVSAEDRLLDPEVHASEGKIVITFWAHPLKGAQTCPSHPPARRVIDLGGPLGSRALADGGVYPPETVLMGKE